MTPDITSRPSSTARDGNRTQRRLLGAGGLAAGTALAMAGYAAFHEPLNIELERLTIRLANAVGRVPAEGLRILHLSDTHFQGANWRERPKIERIARLVADVDCDLLVHTGDFWHYDHGLQNVLALLDVLPTPRLGRYAVLGNHDYTHYAMGEALPRMWRSYWDGIQVQDNGRAVSSLMRPWRLLQFVRYVRNTPLDGRRTGFNDANRLTAALAARGFQLLHNQAIHLCSNAGKPDGVDLYLSGVDDVVEGRPHLHDALDGVPENAPTLLLSHNPDIVASPRIGQVDLVLSGHTHGGQIVLPFWGPAHTQVEHLTREQASGYFWWGDAQVYITRGLGEGIPLRFGARPQLALITVVGEA